MSAMYNQNAGEVLFAAPALQTQSLVCASAAVVLAFCRQNPPNYSAEHKDARVYAAGVLQAFPEDSRWSQSHMMINAIQAHVQVVYSFVELSLGYADFQPFEAMLDRHMRTMFVSALAKYQEWKTELIRQEKAEHGENWGDALLFNQKVWTDLNERYVERFRVHLAQVTTP